MSEAFIYPNPIRHQATLQYELSQPQNIKVSLLDFTGREVAILLTGIRPFGSNEEKLQFSKSLPPGAYFLKINTPDSQNFIHIIIKK